jgi:hypothetical protein
MLIVKRLISFSLFLLFVNQHSFGQIADMDYKLFSIRQEVRRIDKDSSLKRKELDNDEFIDGTDNGSELDGYFKKDSICKMNAWIGLSIWTIQTEYYFKNEKLIFAYEKQFTNVDSTGEVNYNKPKLSFEGRYFLKDAKIIHTKESGRRYVAIEGTITNMLLEDSKSYMKMLKAKKK